MRATAYEAAVRGRAAAPQPRGDDPAHDHRGRSPLPGSADGRGRIPAGVEGQPTEDRELIDAVLSASRALVAVAARSLAVCETDITLQQYRALVVLSAKGSQRVADLAEALGVLSSTATRMCDRLARKGLVRRARSPRDRRSVKVAVTEDGRALVERVTQARRAELQRILSLVPPRGRPALVEALRAFSHAAGEVPEEDWALGWGQ